MSTSCRTTGSRRRPPAPGTAPGTARVERAQVRVPAPAGRAGSPARRCPGPRSCCAPPAAHAADRDVRRRGAAAVLHPQPRVASPSAQRPAAGARTAYGKSSRCPLMQPSRKRAGTASLLPCAGSRRARTAPRRAGRRVVLKLKAPESRAAARRSGAAQPGRERGHRHADLAAGPFGSSAWPSSQGGGRSSVTPGPSSSAAPRRAAGARR